MTTPINPKTSVTGRAILISMSAALQVGFASGSVQWGIAAFLMLAAGRYVIADGVEHALNVAASLQIRDGKREDAEGSQGNQK